MEESAVKIVLELVAINPYEWFWKYLYDWQELIGAFLGAAAPVSLFFIVRWVFERKEYFDNVERSLVLTINNLMEIDVNVDAFIKNKVEKNIKEVQRFLSTDAYFVGRFFFPLMFVFSLPENIAFSRSTGSNYLDNLILKSYSLSQDMPEIVNDMRRQLEVTLDDHRTLCISGKGAYQAINKGHLDNLMEYKNSLETQWFETTVPVILWALVSARVALHEFRKIGYIRWKLKFDPIFKNPFITREARSEESRKNVERFLKEETKKEFEEIYKSNFTRCRSNWAELIHGPRKN